VTHQFTQNVLTSSRELPFLRNLDFFLRSLSQDRLAINLHAYIRVDACAQEDGHHKLKDAFRGYANATEDATF
jgi:hypothetical protein